jgi:hypothetical protein
MEEIRSSNVPTNNQIVPLTNRRTKGARHDASISEVGALAGASVTADREEVAVSSVGTAGAVIEEQCDFPACPDPANG